MIRPANNYSLNKKKRVYDDNKYNQLKICFKLFVYFCGNFNFFKKKDYEEAISDYTNNHNCIIYYISFSSKG